MDFTSDGEKPLNEKQKQAARMVAEGQRNKEITLALRISPRILAYWKKAPEFSREVEAHLDLMEQATYQDGIADRRRLLYASNDLYYKLQAIVTARGKDPSLQVVPGGDTGLLVKTIRSVRTNEEGWKHHVEPCIDATLLNGLQAALEMMARATGLWKKVPERKILCLSDLAPEEINSIIANYEKSQGVKSRPERLAPNSGKPETPKCIEPTPISPKPNPPVPSEPRSDSGKPNPPEPFAPAA
jgi:hypothetical protein